MNPSRRDTSPGSQVVRLEKMTTASLLPYFGTWLNNKVRKKERKKEREREREEKENSNKKETKRGNEKRP